MYKQPEETPEQEQNPNIVQIEAVGLKELSIREGIAYMTAYYRAKKGYYVKVKVCANGKSGKQVTKYLPTAELNKLLDAVNAQK